MWAAAISGWHCRGFCGIDQACGLTEFYATSTRICETSTPEAHPDKSLHPSLAEALHHPLGLLPVHKYGFL
jgi:hypothetical protein